ncbi:MAG: OsmC family protein [Chitinophagales bacterium]
MSELKKIKLAVERSTKALTLKPSLGLGTGISKTRITSGLSCKIQEGSWKLAADMPEPIGGNGMAPTPGVYGRAALGSCLAIGYMLAAAKMNIPVLALEVEVQADFDDGALLGTADVNPGYSEVRYSITIESEAAEEDIVKMLDEADDHSPYLDVFSRAQNCKRTVHIVSSKLNE